MVNLTATELFAFPINRQNLFDHWATAVMGTFSKSNLAPEVFTMDIGTNLSDATSSPQPGHHFWAQQEALMYVWHDEVDDTGVSLWLAIGPDRFDVAAITVQPMAGGAVAQPVYDRWIRNFTGASGLAHQVNAIGTVAGPVDLSSWNTRVLCGTNASGAWVPLSIDGIVWAAYGSFVVAQDRWVRVFDGTPGKIRRDNTNPGAETDATIGRGITGSLTESATTPQALQIFWTGPRVIQSLE